MQRTWTDLLGLTERLIAEYAGAVPAGSVMRCVARVGHNLVAAGFRDDVEATTESIVRRRLAERIALRQFA